MTADTLPLVPLTQLDAVNIMLLSIGQTPVNSLTVSGIKDVAIALTTLHNISRTVQTEGFSFNSDDSYPLSPDVDNVIAIPTNTLKIKPSDRALRYVNRAGNVYDKDLQSTTLDPTKRNYNLFNIVWYLNYEDLPQSARDYIAIRAARVFQARAVGSPELYKFTEDDELLARGLMLADEDETSSDNMFTDSYSVSSIWNRLDYDPLFDMLVS